MDEIPLLYSLVVWSFIENLERIIFCTLVMNYSELSRVVSRVFFSMKLVQNDLNGDIKDMCSRLYRT